MFRFVALCFGMLVRFFRERRTLLLENLALRQQLVALKRQHPRPSLGLFDKLFWVIARWVWSAWKHSLILVTPETSSVGTGLVFESTRGCSPEYAGRSEEDRRRMRFGKRSFGLSLRTQPGV